MFLNSLFSWAAPPLLATVLLSLVGCERMPSTAPEASGSGTEDVGYAVPPAVTDVRLRPSGVVMGGRAAPGMEVRLATPAGEAVTARADAQGRWMLLLPPAGQPRIFGLSEHVQGRRVQGQGYVLVTPQGRTALLRAGAGAIRLEPRKAPALSAVDFDQGGAVVVSGLAAPGAPVFLRLDGRSLVQARADDAGRYFIALPQPVSRGVHRLEVAGDNFSNSAEVEFAPARPLAEPPMRSQFTKGALRIDWLTPGGGVQSTVLFD